VTIPYRRERPGVGREDRYNARLRLTVHERFQERILFVVVVVPQNIHNPIKKDKVRHEHK
jgi:hypothetical protein